MNRIEKEELIAVLKEKQSREKYNKIRYIYPDTDNLNFSADTSGKIYAREKYQKHLEFFRAGKQFRQRLFCAGNRVGKSFSGLTEVVYHATGAYPAWWQGKEFNRATTIWIGGFTMEMMKSSVMEGLLGKRGEYGSGLLPKDSIFETRAAPGTPDAVSTVKVKHTSGSISTIHFKTYESGLEGFAGAAVDVILLDEEPPLKVYTECVMRTATTNGIVMVTFTPDRGFSETVLSFFENGEFHEGVVGSKYVVVCGWSDIPHLSPELQQELIKAIPLHLRDAKTKGVPYLGSGAIYPVLESEFAITPIEISDRWARAYGLDVGWNMTAGVFGALDIESDTWYIYSEYYRGHAEPSVHAAGIKARGDWIPGVIDKAARGRSQVDGEQLFELYLDLGLELITSDKSKIVESGILNVLERLSTGRLKIFKTCTNLLNEMRIYRRDDKGKIVKKNDHALDALRYLIDSGKDIMLEKPQDQWKSKNKYTTQETGRSEVGGY